MVRFARLRGPQAGHGLTEARRIAYRVLRRVSDQGAFADRAFRAEADRAELDPRERAFAQQLAYGTLQRRATLDYVLTALSARPIDSLDPPLRDALHLGIYQLVYTGVPDHAAVEQTVELAKLERGGSHRFANAVMRRASREALGLVGELTADSPADAAVLHSHPEWLVRLWWDLLGREETIALLERDNAPAESAVRANELVTTRAELGQRLAALGVEHHSAPPELPEGLVLETPFDLHGSDLFHSGALMPQSRASMLVSRVLDPQPGEDVLDLCAAPGAKTTHIAALMRGQGRLVSLEHHKDRSEALERNCRRMHAPWVEVLCDDASAPASLDGRVFDRVLLDPPCSDLGTLQSRPDVRWRKSEDQIEGLGHTQDALLDAAAERVRPGGVLVYSTCTISPHENEERVHALLARRPDFDAGDLAAEHADYAHPRVPRFLQLMPHRNATDGFFIARLERQA